MNTLTIEVPPGWEARHELRADGSTRITVARQPCPKLPPDAVLPIRKSPTGVLYVRPLGSREARDAG